MFKLICILSITSLFLACSDYKRIEGKKAILEMAIDGTVEYLHHNSQTTYEVGINDKVHGKIYIKFPARFFSKANHNDKLCSYKERMKKYQCSQDWISLNRSASIGKLFKKRKNEVHANILGRRLFLADP